MEEIKVYRMNKCDCMASKWSVEETNDFYSNNFADNDIKDVTEVDLDNEGMWMETNVLEDIERLGDADEIISEIGKPKPDDLLRHGYSVCKWVLYREAIKVDLDFIEPYVISSTEW